MAVDWERAACREHEEPDLWFPGVGEPPHRARAICASCPIIRACGEYARTNSILYGLWGGLTVNERANRRTIDDKD